MDRSTSEETTDDDRAGRFRTERLPAIRVTERELRTIRLRAKQAGLKVSDLVRSRAMLPGGSVLDDARPSRKSPRIAQRDELINALAQVTQELRRIGNNVNQLARKAHVADELRYKHHLETDLAQLEEAVDAITRLIPDIK